VLVENRSEMRAFVNMAIYITVPLKQGICWLAKQVSTSQGTLCTRELEYLEENLRRMEKHT
jgi:hypothetical protein